MTRVNTKERIMQAALKLFVEQGYQKTSIARIETEAGLAPRAGAFYRHFESKEALFMETDEERSHADYLRQFCKEVKTITLHPYSDELKSSFLFSKLFAVINACLLMRKEVLNQLKKEDLDLVQCAYVHTLNFIPNLSRYPSLLTHHEVLSLAHNRNFHLASGIYQKASRFLKWRITQAYEKRVCRKVKSIVALSSVDQNYLKSRLKLKNVRLAQTGVDTEYFKSCPTCEEIPNSLIFVGWEWI